MALGEKQYELGGVTFGHGCPVEVFDDGWQPGMANRTTQDQPLPAGDGVRFGVDRDGSATWSFSLFTNSDDEGGAWAALGELGTAWVGDDHRGQSGAVVPLRYCVAGKTRRVYGRPRRWTHSPDNLSLGGMIRITADFATADPRVYDDALQTTELAIAAPADPTDGVIVPFIPPFDTSASVAQRQSSITIGGTVPTPITVTVHGPVAGAEVRTSGWTAKLVDAVTDDDPVIFDPNVWARSVTRRSGGSVRVNPRVTRVSQMLLAPGTHDLTFSGNDPTGTARVEVSWHNAHRLPR